MECPRCRETNYQIFLDKRACTLYRCLHCGFIFMDRTKRRK